MKMTRFPGISLDVTGLVVKSVMPVSNPLMESILVLVTEWISSKDTTNSPRRCTLSCKPWLGTEIVESLGDHTWIDMSEEWAEFMFGEGSSPGS